MNDRPANGSGTAEPAYAEIDAATRRLMTALDALESAATTLRDQSAALRKQLDATPALRERMEGLGAVVVSDDRATPQYLGQFVKSEIAKWAAPIKASGVTID